MPAGGGPRRRFLTLLALAGGLALLGWLLHHIGFQPVWQRLRVLGWAAPLVFLPYLLVTVVDARGWRLTLPVPQRVPLLGLMLTRMAGEAVNSLTPGAAVGEPVKAYLLRRWHVTAADALASVVISKTALVASQSLFTALGVGAILWRLERPRLATGWLAALSVGCVAFTAGLVWVQRRSPGTALWKLLRRVAPRSRLVKRLEAGTSAFDHRLREFYPASLLVPAGIGPQVLGGVWLSTCLGMSEADAVTLWLLKRARELFFDAVGFVYLAQRGGRRALRAT